MELFNVEKEELCQGQGRESKYLAVAHKENQDVYLWRSLQCKRRKESIRALHLYPQPRLSVVMWGEQGWLELAHPQEEAISALLF